jgi:hypothetical protein
MMANKPPSTLNEFVAAPNISMTQLTPRFQHNSQGSILEFDKEKSESPLLWERISKILFQTLPIVINRGEKCRNCIPENRECRVKMLKALVVTMRGKEQGLQN